MTDLLRWDLEERLEDAVVQYLNTSALQSTSIKVFPAFSTAIIEYPCAVVHCGRSQKLVESGEFTVHRQLDVEVAVMTEASNQMDALGLVTLTARQRNADARNAVINALGVMDDNPPPGISSLCSPEDVPVGLAAWLDIQKIDGIWVSHAHIGEITRSLDTDKKCLVSTISIGVIAQPVKIGGY